MGVIGVGGAGWTRANRVTSPSLYLTTHSLFVIHMFIWFVLSVFADRPNSCGWLVEYRQKMYSFRGHKKEMFRVLTA